MIKAIHSLPVYFAVFAYVVLTWGVVVSILFITRYAVKLPWRSTPEGRHLVAMTANILAFLTTFLVQALIPDWWWRPYLMVALLVGLVGNLTWRWLLLEKALRKRRTAREEAT